MADWPTVEELAIRLESLFVAGTTEMVAGRVQSTWLLPDVMTPWPEAPELDAAMKRAGVW